MAIFVQIKAMARQNDMGREGESEARAYLVKHGYNVLHTNWHGIIMNWILSLSRKMS